MSLNVMLCQCKLGFQAGWRLEKLGPRPSSKARSRVAFHAIYILYIFFISIYGIYNIYIYMGYEHGMTWIWGAPGEIVEPGDGSRSCPAPARLGKQARS